MVIAHFYRTLLSPAFRVFIALSPHLLRSTFFRFLFFRFFSSFIDFDYSRSRSRSNLFTFLSKQFINCSSTFFYLQICLVYRFLFIFFFFFFVFVLFLFICFIDMFFDRRFFKYILIKEILN